MKPIKFLHSYLKLPDGFAVVDDDEDVWNEAVLLQVFVCDVKELSAAFREYDTKYIEHEETKFYGLPKGGKVLVLFFLCDNSSSFVFTTVRRWTPEKEKYYRGLVGQSLRVDVQEEVVLDGG